MFTFEVYTYGGAEYLRLIFNGIAAITGSGDYLVALKIAALLGVIGVLLRVMFTARLLEMSWILAMVVVLYAAFVPRANVMIVDRIDPAMNSVVANVPLGVAATAGMASQFGDWLTRAFETVFSLPDDLKYSANGTLFGARLVEASTRFEITDQRTAENLSEFWANCVYYDVLLGLYTWDELTWSSDLWPFLQSRTSQVRRFPYRQNTAGAIPQDIVCREGIAPGQYLDRDLQWALGRAQTYYARKIFSGLSPAEALAKFSAAMPVSYQYLTQLSLDTAAVMRQTIVANSLKRGLINFSTRSDATAAAVDYATARAEAERRTTYQAVGEMALRTLPLLRNIFEALIYAIFPIVLLLALIVPKPAVVGYLKSIFWIQLWAPLYAILHLGVMLYARGEAYGAVIAPVGSPGLTLANLTALGQSLSDMGYIAGYLSMSIPLIAYMVVQSGGAMMGSLAATITSGVQMAAARGAEEATTGNISMGNSSFDNVNWFKNNRAPVSNVFGGTQTGPDGTVTTLTADGHAFHAYPHHAGIPLSVDGTQGTRSYLQTQAGESMQAARQDIIAYANAVSANYQSLTSYLHQATKGQGVSHEIGTSQTASVVKEAGEVRELAQRFAEKHGLDESQSAALLATASANLSPPGGLGKFMEGLGIEVSAQGQILGRSDMKASELWEQARDYAERTQFGKQWREVQDAVERSGLSRQLDERLSASDSEQGGWSQLDSLRDEAQASLQTARYWQRMQSYASEQGITISQDLTAAAIRSLPGQPKPDGGTWSEQEVQDLIVRANAGEREAAEALNHAVGRLIATDPWFYRQAGLPASPEDAGLGRGAVLRQHAVDRADIEAQGTETVDRKAEANKDDVREYGSLHSQAERSANPLIQEWKEQAARQAAAIQAEHAARREVAGREIASREQRVDGEGGELRRTAEAKTDPDQQHLLVDAVTNGIERVLPSRDDVLAVGRRRFFGRTELPKEEGNANEGKK